MASAAAIVRKAEPKQDVSAEVNPAGSHPRGILRWGYFIVLNAISAVVAVAIFIGIFYADGIDPYMRGTYEWLLAHPGVTSFMAFSPLASSLLVGWGYSQRARKRKAAAARAAEAARAGQAAGAGAADRASGAGAAVKQEEPPATAA